MADETTETESETTETEATEGAETATEETGTGEAGSGEDTGTGSGPSQGDDQDDGGDAYWQAEIAKRDAEIEKYRNLARSQEAKYKAAVKGTSSEPETGSSRTPSAQQTAGGGQQGDTGSSQEPTQEDRLQQLADEIARIKADHEQAARERTVADVAKAKGLSVEQAGRLRGSSREELEADADEVIALFGLDQTKKTPGPAPKPKEKKPAPVRGGSSNADAGDGRSREDILAAVTDTGRRTKK
ncbi:hypothetical protein [Streptomonospora litoralis]|uniref:Scaffolding protein n=1 Tax=Streptomonospora litoralis TaxID=2498135 RepID=A0A4P6Q7X4_9ACTN|nr:hypothetical protein [Streptomonospora litoralis]QBI56805.1 hypothetical protein EKD16_25320 [Streptomonospora litoralis]